MAATNVFQEVVDFVNSYPSNGLTLGGDFWLQFCDLRKAFEYIHFTNNKEFPYKTGKAFTKDLKSYGPWNIFLLDIGTTKEKITVSYPKTFMTEVRAWYLTQKPNKSKNEKGITKEHFDDIPMSSNITRID